MGASMERILLYVVVLALAVAVGWLAFASKQNGGTVGQCVGCDELKALNQRLDAIDTAVDGLGKTVAEAVEPSLANFKQGVVDDVASRLEVLISALGDETANALVGIEVAVVKMIEERLDGLEGRVADGVDRDLVNFKQGVVDDVARRVAALISAHGKETAAALDGLDAAVAEKIEDGLAERIAEAVSGKLLAEGCRLTTEGECPPPRPPCPTPPDAEACDEPPPPITVNSRFTFLYENARLDAAQKVTEDSLGVKLAARHHKRLELLTNAFMPCNQADHPVKFRVTGYSSSAEFRVRPSGESMDDSDDLNRRTANLRAKIVGDYLHARGFEVDTKEWPKHDRQRPQRPYLDDAQPGMDQQALNRTVFIELTSAGACDLAR